MRRGAPAPEARLLRRMFPRRQISTAHRQGQLSLPHGCGGTGRAAVRCLSSNAGGGEQKKSGGKEAGGAGEAGGGEGDEDMTKEIVLTPGEKVVAATRLTMWAGIAVFACACAYYIGAELIPTYVSNLCSAARREKWAEGAKFLILQSNTPLFFVTVIVIIFPCMVRSQIETKVR